MTLDIRPLVPEELTAFATVAGRSFLSTHDPAATAEWRRLNTDFTRAWAAYDETAMVATCRSFPTDLTVPGGASVVADAVTTVTVSATHRRRGLLTRLMKLDLDAARERGEPVSILIAAEYPIYGRFGFGPATEHVELAVETARASFAVPGEGRVEYVDAATARKHAPGVYDAHRRCSPSEISRTDIKWDAHYGIVPAPWADEVAKTQFAVCFDEHGEAVGYVDYRAEDVWEARVPRCVVKVTELVAATPAAYARLWRFLCEIDWIATVKAEDRSVGEPLPWLLTDARAVRYSGRSDFQWVRVLDVPAALSARRYLTEGRLVLEVVDAQGYTGGRFSLDGGPDGAACHPTTESPQITLDVAALGAGYLGGFPLCSIAAGGGVDEHADGAVARADAMFRSTVTPWSATWF